MNFLWGGSATAQQQEQEKQQEKARMFLCQSFTKFDQARMDDITRLLEEYKGREDELIETVRKEYEGREDPHAKAYITSSEERSCAKTKLEAVYRGVPEQEAAVADMLERYAGRESELVREMSVSYRDAAHLARPMPLLDAATVELRPNLGLPVKLQTKRLYYAGHLYRKTFGWLSAQETRWVMLIGQQLYVGADPQAPPSEFETFSVKDCTVSDEPDLSAGEYMFKVARKDTKAEYFFFTKNEVDKLLWAVTLEIAILQANPDTPCSEDSREMYHKVFAEYPIKPSIPYYADRRTRPPEELDAPLLKGYVVSSIGSSWLGADWARRYITLHATHLTIRGDKYSVAGVQLLPLRDAHAVVSPPGTEDATSIITLSSAFAPALSLSPDDDDAVAKWSTKLADAIADANPDRSPAAAAKVAAKPPTHPPPPPPLPPPQA